MTVNGRSKVCEPSFAMVTTITVTVLTIIIGALCGCGAVPQSKYYQLSAPREVSSLATADPLPITLLVGPLKSSHLYREDRLVYATGGVEMGAYEGRRWVQPSTE